MVNSCKILLFFHFFSFLCKVMDTIVLYGKTLVCLRTWQINQYYFILSRMKYRKVCNEKKGFTDTRHPKIIKTHSFKLSFTHFINHYAPAG